MFSLIDSSATNTSSLITVAIPPTGTFSGSLVLENVQVDSSVPSVSFPTNLALDPFHPTQALLSANTLDPPKRLSKPPPPPSFPAQSRPKTPGSAETSTRFRPPPPNSHPVRTSTPPVPSPSSTPPHTLTQPSPLQHTPCTAPPKSSTLNPMPPTP